MTHQPSKSNEKCLVQLPTFNDDGTEKDIDYWVFCLKDKPCPIHDTQPSKSNEEIAHEIANSGAHVDLTDSIVIEANIETALEAKDRERERAVAAERESLIKAIKLLKSKFDHPSVYTNEHASIYEDFADEIIKTIDPPNN